VDHQANRKNQYGMNEMKEISCELRDEKILVLSGSVEDLTYCPLCGEEIGDSNA